MTWLGGRMKWPFGGGGTAVAELEPEIESEATDDGKPHLVMLAADASGLASFKLYSFSDSETAVEFIQRSFGNRSDTGLIAFWAMTEEPAVHPQPGVDTALEAMVMIRDEMRPEVVYPFSFVDIATARSFVQYEMKRGLDPNQVLLYWAVPVQLGISSTGELGLFPNEPPHRADTSAAGEFVAQAVAVGPAVGEEPPAVVVEAGELLESLSVRVVFDGPLASTEDDPIEALFLRVDGAVEEEPAIEATATVEEEIAELAGGGDEPHEEEAVEALAADEPAETIEEAIAEEDQGDATMAEPNEVQHETVTAAFEPDEAGSNDELAEPIEAVAARALVGEPMGTEFAAGRAYARSEAPQFNANDELQKVLRVRRWEEHSEPFRGFQSPPGRF